MQVQLIRIYCIKYCQKSIGSITVLEERLGIQYGFRHLRNTVATWGGVEPYNRSKICNRYCLRINSNDLVHVSHRRIQPLAVFTTSHYLNQIYRNAGFDRGK